MCEGNLDVTFRIISLCFTMLSWYMSQRCLEEKARRMAVCIVLARPKQYSKIWRKAISILNTVVSVLSCNCSPKILLYLQIKLSKLSPFLNTKEGLHIASPFFRSSKVSKVDKGRQKPRVTKEVPDSLMKGELRR